MTNNKPTIRQIGIQDVKFGMNVTLIEPVSLYKCTLGDDVFVGPFTEIQGDVMVEARTRIQSHSFICEMVTIGTECFIAHGVMFVNDLFKRGFPERDHPENWLPTVIGNKVSIGSNVTILPVRICDNVVIGAGSVVTRNISEPGYYSGVPAKKIRPQDAPI